MYTLAVLDNWQEIGGAAAVVLYILSQLLGPLFSKKDETSKDKPGGGRMPTPRTVNRPRPPAAPTDPGAAGARARIEPIPRPAQTLPLPPGARPAPRPSQIARAEQRSQQPATRSRPLEPPPRRPEPISRPSKLEPVRKPPPPPTRKAPSAEIAAAMARREESERPAPPIESAPHESLLSPQVHAGPRRKRRGLPTELARMLRSPRGLRSAMLLTEILAPPLALRENPLNRAE